MYTSLKISKLIQERVPEVIPAKKEHNVIGEDTYLYTLADVIRAIKVLGEKKEDWIKRDEMCAKTTRLAGGIMSDKQKVSSLKAHDLLDAYLPTLSLQSEEVEKVIISIFK